MLGYRVKSHQHLILISNPILAFALWGPVTIGDYSSPTNHRWWPPDYPPCFVYLYLAFKIQFDAIYSQKLILKS